MNETGPRHKKRLHFGLLLLSSFVIFNLGYIVDQTVRWSDHFKGFKNGVVHVMVFGIAWGIFLLPWSLLVFVLYRWRKWKRFRTCWVLAPAVLVLIASVAGLIVRPSMPQSRFKNFAKTDLPTDARNLRYHFSGGGFADYVDTYYFETTPQEVGRLIRDLSLEPDEVFGFEGTYFTPVKPMPGWPDFSTWEGAKQFKGWDFKRQWYYYLITDSSKTHIYLQISCT